MNEKFTKGPWVRGYHANTCQYVRAGNGLNGDYVVCSTSGPDEIANANLISCAPDMYEMLKEIANARENRYDVSAARIWELLARARGDV